MTIAPRNRVSGGWLIALITLVDAMSAVWFGYCQGVFAGVLVSADFQELFPQTTNANISGIVTSSFLLGAFLGAILAFVSGDRLGRKKTIILGHTLNFTGAILQCRSWSLSQMCARSHLRGRLLVIGASSNVSSFCVANWISYGLYYQTSPLQWRFPLGFQLVFACILAPIVLVVPESPRWLLLVDRETEALEVIARLAGTGVQDELATAEYMSIKETIRLERDTRVPVVDVLCHRDKTQNFRRLILSCGTQFMQQFSGINALGFYLPTLLQDDVGFDNKTARLLTAVSGTIYLLSAFGSLVVIDRVGRRKLMLVGSILTATCHLTASLCLKAADDNPCKKKTMGNVVVAMFVLYHVFFGCTWGGVPWVYSAEVNSLGWRTRGAAAATATNWLMAFVVVQFTKVGIDNLVFAIISFSYFPVVFCFYSETSRRTLEDTDLLFIRNPGVLVFGKDEMTNRERPMALIVAERERIARGSVALTAGV
ncbi:putative sugar transporter [Xylariales sp. AK1849]|nr:putative sugar transporter [Xylariales sp. AK1849]